MKNLKRIVFFAILIVSLSICTNVNAEEVSVSTFDELKTALGNGGSIKLDSDITSTSQLQLSKTATIDLNGHTLTTEKSIFIFNNVTIIDNSTEKKGIITNGSNEIIPIYIGYSTSYTGNLKLKSGTIQSNNKKNVLYVYNGSFELDDGMVKNAGNGYAIYSVAGTTINITGGIVASPNNYGIMSSGTLTINDGEISALATTVLNNGSLTIKGGTISSKASNYPAVATYANTNTTIDGGNITSKNNAILNVGNLTINDGMIYSSNNIAIKNNGNLTINDGTVYSLNNIAILNNDSAKMIMTGGEVKTDAQTTSEKGFDAIQLYGNNELTINGGTISAPNSYGISAFDNSKVTINDGVVSSYYMTLVGNGSDSGKDVSFEINGGTFTSSTLVAYFPQINGKNKITGGTFTGPTAIEIRAGNLDITGGRFIATYDTLEVKSNGNGATTLGAALAVVQHTTKQPIEVNVSGGEFIGVASINSANPEQNSAEDIAKVRINVFGGTYKPKVSDDFIKEGYTQYKIDDKYIVGKVYFLDDKEITSGLEAITDLIAKTIVTNGSINGLDNDTIDAIKNAVDNNKKLSMQVRLVEIKNQVVTNEQKEMFISKVKGNQKIGSYFDIKVMIKANGIEIGEMTELPNNIKITLKLSDELLAVKDGFVRKYKVLRLHDGIVETLDATLNSDNTLTFRSDKFSLYAVVYEDILDAKKDVENPQTGDNIMFYILILTLSIFSLGGSMFYIKKNNQL